VNIPGGIISWSSADTLVIISTSSADVGSYTFTLTAKDEQPLTSESASLTLIISNTSPKLVSIAPPDINLVHKKTTSIDLATYFTDEEVDSLAMTATYSFNGASEMAIPGGIFTLPTEFQIDVASTSIADSGEYTIKLTVSDVLLATLTQTFKVTVTNAAPKITSSLPNPSIVHGKSISMPLAGYFIDDDGDTMTMTATYSLNGGIAQPMPGGLFTYPTPFTICATSIGLIDVGTYTISVIISDSELTVPATFTLDITNTSPR
jgi:hypothetical protein